MVQENEVIILILGIAVLGFILSNISKVKKLPLYGVMLTAFIVLLLGGTFTVLEGFFLAEILNMAEHIAYTLCAVLLLAWVLACSFIGKCDEVKQ